MTQDDRTFLNKVEKGFTQADYTKRQEAKVILQKCVYEMLLPKNKHKQVRKLYKRFYAELYSRELDLNDL